jgi:hypothetical protein
MTVTAPGAPALHERFATAAPSGQLTADIFKGEWNSKLPGNIASGEIDLFHDGRMDWAHEAFDFRDKSILELGPLEAAHTCMAHHFGAKSILAVEGNARAYLKCLIVKELYSLDRARFLYGDFVRFMEQCPSRYDLILACGVLYHSREPLRLLQLVGQQSNRVMLWTHHYIEARYRDILGDGYGARFPHPHTVEQAGYRCAAHEYRYGHAVEDMAFPGGTAPTAILLAKQDIIGFLRHLGFARIETAHEQPDHPNGPAISMCASR